MPAGDDSMLDEAAGELDALLQTEEPEALTARGPGARGGDVEARAVVADHQLERAVPLDRSSSSIRFAAAWRTTLVTASWTTRKHVIASSGAGSWASASMLTPRREPGALRLRVHVPAQRGGQPEVVEQRGPEVEGELAHAAEQALDDRRASRRSTRRRGVAAPPQHQQVDADRGEGLAHLVVELPRDVPALRLLDLEQRRRQRLEAGGRLLRRR